MTLKELATEGIRQFDNELSARGCNDFRLPLTNENLQLYKEFWAWNLKVPIYLVENHNEYIEPQILEETQEILCSDGILIFALRKIVDEAN